MLNINEFCMRLVGSMLSYLRDRNALNLLTQNETSCKAIIKTCIDIEPDYVVEIGTNYGLSTLSLAYALKFLGKEVSDLTTIDISHDHWKNETPGIQQDVLGPNGININGIKTVTEDFIKLHPEPFMREGKVLVFYDIHDTEDVSYAQKFLDEWIPLFDYGHVLFHDFNILGKNPWIRMDKKLPLSTAKHFSGLPFEGYKECKVVIDWMNETHRKVRKIPQTSIAGFQI